ncbi:putative disease resistance protein [Dichanthelium oligosanthes]|uniref:Putative disease resistance protein n=1 Tax=Dichanthelium oligosanthes TaxID=888268 RepID=A0A1E5VUG7_9POAL|nr:putative disease resistance protein [Dichanthelium oligosanthes]
MVCSIEEWDWIRMYLPNKKNGSRVMVSTQQPELASLCTEQPNQVSELKQMSSDQAIYLFYKVSGPATLERIYEIELDARLSRNDGVVAPGSSQMVPPDDGEDISVGTGESLQVIKKFMSVPQQPLTLYWTMPEDALEESQLIGRDREKREVIQLISHRNERRQVISVWGMCGIGKTTLVRSVYGSRDLNGLFQKRAWNKLATMAIEDLIQESIRLLEGHKYLVVLDDILSIAEWDLILPFLPEENSSSRIIITTREECVATRSSREYKLRPLQDEPLLDIFKEKVFKKARKIHLNPDMIKEGPKHLGVEKFECPFSAELDNNPSLQKLKTVLTLSYESLPHNLKPCFLYLSIFPEDHCIWWRRLVKRWIAARQTRGLTADEAAEKQFMDLMNKSMIQPSESEEIASTGGKKIDFCQFHDLMHEISISKSEEENLVCVLEEQSTMHFKDKARHLVVRSSWNRDTKQPLQTMMDISHIRSVTVFGEWRSYFLSKKMRFLRVLDLECTSGLQDHDIVPIGELLHLKYLSLRGSLRVLIFQLEKLKYFHAGLVPDDETDSRAEITELFRECCSAAYKMCTGDSSDVEDGKECLKYLTPLSNIAFDLLLRGLDPYGVKAPRGIGRLKALHTLGVVNIARGNAVLKELKKLTLLRKLGVSGINRKNCKDLCSSITNNSLLCSLSMGAEGDLGLEGCLDGLSLPPKELQSLKLYGNLVLGKLPSLSIVRLRKRSCEDGLQHFHFHLDTFTILRVLDLESLEHIKSVTFEAGATPKFEISGLLSIKSLKEVSLKGSNNGMLKNVLQVQLAKNQNKPELKIEDLMVLYADSLYDFILFRPPFTTQLVLAL